MEETLTPDVVVNHSKLTIGDKTYSLYCKRDKKEQAEAVRDDLIANGFDATVRRVYLDYHTVFEIWWRKNSFDNQSRQTTNRRST
jgi:hypothetical protein